MPTPSGAAAPFAVTLFHNPACGTSRAVLALLRAAGHEPEIVPYLETGWPADRLERLLAAMGVGARAMLRGRGTPAAALGLLEPGVTDKHVLDAMLAHPVLVERPIVATPLGTVLARPPERAWSVLPDRADQP